MLPKGSISDRGLKHCISCLFIARFISLLIRLGLGPVKSQNFLIPTGDALSVQHDREITFNHAQPIVSTFLVAPASSSVPRCSLVAVCLVRTLLNTQL